MESRIVLTGYLSFIILPDVFQMLGGPNCTGTLHLTSQYSPTKGLIYFANGNLINAANGPLHGIDAIYSLFGWTEGKFEFFQEKVQVERVVNNDRMEIVLEAMRMLDEGEIKKIGPDEAIHGKAKDKKKDSLPLIKRPITSSLLVVDHEKFRDGMKIVRDKGHGNWIWIILSGVVKITRETPKGLVTISRLGEGCFVGNLASFTILGGRRTADVTAEGDVRLGVLDFQSLSYEYSSLSSEFKELLLSLDGRLRKITDRIVDLFLKKNKTDELIKNKKIFLKEGSSKKEMLTITEGEAYIIRKTPRGYLLLATLEKGDFFGYIPFMDMGHEPRSATVLASQDLKVNKLDIENLQKEYYQLSGSMRGLIDNVANSVTLTTIRASHLKIK